MPTVLFRLQPQMIPSGQWMGVNDYVRLDSGCKFVWANNLTICGYCFFSLWSSSLTILLFCFIIMISYDYYWFQIRKRVEFYSTFSFQVINKIQFLLSKSSFSSRGLTLKNREESWIIFSSICTKADVPFGKISRGHGERAGRGLM